MSDLTVHSQPVYQKISKRIAAAKRKQSTPPTTKPKPKTKQPPNAAPQADLLTDLLTLHQTKPDQFTDHYLRRMAITNFGAGHETMCSALTSIMAMIGSHPSVQQRILQEIRQLLLPCSPTKQIISLEASVQSLPYTHATIKEALRLHPVIGMSLSRRVPAGGFVVGGHRIPAGTSVGCNPIALHRNKDIFGDDAEEFVPERWLRCGNEDQRRVMERYTLTWGGGGRTCPGRHLAEMVLFKVVPALVGALHVDVTTMPGEEEQRVFFLSMIEGVRVRFRGRDD